ncbi:MAG: hypothetical protein HIU81_14290 [Acidobacteria bacterium]|nr:hypothetical protein [Acidobacteriota bacterium]
MSTITNRLASEYQNMSNVRKGVYVVLLLVVVVVAVGVFTGLIDPFAVHTGTTAVTPATPAPTGK